MTYVLKTFCPKTKNFAKWWTNFIWSIDGNLTPQQFDIRMNEVLKSYNATATIGPNMSDDVIFETEQDAMFFILRWL